MEKAWELAVVSEDPSVEVTLGEGGLRVSAKASAVDRLLHSLADFVAPVTEVTGLIGTHIRGKRLESAAEAAIRVEALLKNSGKAPSKLPLKLLLPWVEGVSLEDFQADPEMKELWAQLLISATTGENPNAMFFTDLLKRMSGEHARYLKSVVNWNTNDDIAQNLWDTAIHFDPEAITEDLNNLAWTTKEGGYFVNAPGSAQRENTNTAYTQETFVKLASERLNHLSQRSGVDAIHFSLFVKDQMSETVKDTIIIVDTGDQRYDKYGLKEALVALGLMEAFQFGPVLIGPSVSVSGRYVRVSTLGVNFLSACTELL